MADTANNAKASVGFRFKARRARSDLQDYENQSYIGHLLDEHSFDLQNNGRGENISFLYRQGALDAPDAIPAGSMRNVGGNLYDRTLCERGMSLEE